MQHPPEIEIAAAYFRMWADNLRQFPITDEEVANTQAMTNALQAAAASLQAGNHLTWWASQGNVPKPRERPSSGPHVGCLKEVAPSVGISLDS